MTPQREVERRVLDAATMDLRAEKEDGRYYVTGRVVPYNVWANIGGRFEERHAARVFAKSIQERAKTLPLFLDHGHDRLPVGTSAEWDDRDDALYGRWLVAETRDAADIVPLVKDGALVGLSAGFVPIRSEWEFAEEPGEMDRVTRLEARLAEVSLTAMPTWEEAVLLTRTAEGRRDAGTPRVDAWRKFLDGIK